MSWQFGLIGYPLGHSFSKQYFANKFSKEHLPHSYQLLETKSEAALAPLLTGGQYRGFNVTIPYKQAVIPHLHRLDKSAQLVGAVNVIKYKNQVLTGYNTDYPAFKATLKKWLDTTAIRALVLGTGGASKAVITALNDLKIDYRLVSRQASGAQVISYEAVAAQHLLATYHLIINTTPLGMAPNTRQAPALPYQELTPQHYLYDLVYNPAQTTFLTHGKQAGATTHNGLDMLHLQAELAWNIWKQ